MSGALDRIDDALTWGTWIGLIPNDSGPPLDLAEVKAHAYAALADLEALVKAATPIVETWDLHAADYLAELVDGHEMRVLRAMEVAEMIEQQKALAAALARVLGEEQT